LRVQGGRKIKENDGGDEFKYDIFYIRTLVNAIMYPQHNNKKKRKKENTELKRRKKKSRV
jgi:hypothetical protein